MDPKKQNILVVDDDQGVLSALNMLLKSEGIVPELVSYPDKALNLLLQRDFALILLDLNYSLDTTSGEEGLSLIRSIRQLDELVPIVVMSGWGTIEIAVKAMRDGANDFIQKPWENDRLLAIIKNQTQLADAQRQSQKLSEQNQLLQEEVRPTLDIIAHSPSIKRVLNKLQQVAQSNANILLTGENGTGKSMFARYLHELSERRSHPLICVNMGAVTESLFESEMFGHIKGAFTDAKSARIGRFELADEGTLFLDEIANTPLSQQGKLLRVLEDKQFEKVGSGKTQTVNFRLICATNSDLHEAVTNGMFRKDLLYRINTVEIEVPPLSQRIDDIIPLARAFLVKAAQKYSKPALSIDPAAESLLKIYPWPGNVRELGHVMERAQILCQTLTIQPHDLGLNAVSAVGQSKSAFFPLNSAHDLRPMEEIEMDIISERLAYFGGDVSRAAKSLGLSRSAFYRRIGKFSKA